MKITSYLVGGIIYLLLIVGYRFYQNGTITLSTDYVITLAISYAMVVVSFLFGDLIVKKNKR